MLTRKKRYPTKAQFETIQTPEKEKHNYGYLQAQIHEKFESFQQNHKNKTKIIITDDQTTQKKLKADTGVEKNRTNTGKIAKEIQR